ncbi:phosphatase PAP2 family protein [Bauldia sp.]|uniref:phosphatase PAP2 family protein n=1 Tax=Bauldia sp. TaxID=2575872 RepID=UPI003BAA6C17
MVKCGGTLTVLVIALAVIGLDMHAVDWASDFRKGVKAIHIDLTRFGKSEWWLIPSGSIALLVLFADWRATQRRVAAAWGEIGELAGFFFCTVAAAGLVTMGLKFLIGRVRPRFAEESTAAFEPFSFAYQHLSFPSGHTTTIVAAATACALIFRGRTGLVLFIGVIAVGVAVSRVVVRAHYPSDIIAGAFVGAAFTIIYAYALGRSGVAFQRSCDGSLMPKTTAIRGVYRQIGIHGLAAGLWQALRGGRRDQEAAAARPATDPLSARS